MRKVLILTILFLSTVSMMCYAAEDKRFTSTYWQQFDEKYLGITMCIIKDTITGAEYLLLKDVGRQAMSICPLMKPDKE